MKTSDNYKRNVKQPVPFPRTVRNPREMLNTSSRAGVVMPAGFIPLMPEDGIKAGSSVEILIQMEETEKMLGNAVHVRAHAHFVSYAALDRFEGIDSVMYAWAQKAGSASIVSLDSVSAPRVDFFKHFGEHLVLADDYNIDYVRAYNTVVNFRRSSVSKSLPVRSEDASGVARALWGETALARIVPDWDAGLLEASAELTFGGTNLPLSGDADITGIRAATSTSKPQTRDPDGTVHNNQNHSTLHTNDVNGAFAISADLSSVFAQLSGGAGTVSLAAIENAKRTKAFAEMRARMSGTDDDLIDLLMKGLSIPSNAYHDPILIGSSDVNINQTARYATDSANLDNYVANGVGAIRIPLNLPTQTTGGFVVFTYEIVPEPVFARQADNFLQKTFVELPNALRDYLDTQPVQVVPNKFVDTLHTVPDGTFGYAPLNHDWSQARVKMGGRYLQGLSAVATDEDQQHIWSVRTVDPTLDEDSFLVPSDFAHDPFLDTIADPFIVRVQYSLMIEGITQFGPALYESTGDYAAVAAVVPPSDLVPPSEV